MKRPRSLLVLVAAAAALMLAPAAHAGVPKKYFKAEATTEVGIKAPAESPAQELAEKYVPIAEIREETDPPCDTSEEQYQPTSVETVLGNPTVLLQHEAGGGKLTTIRRAPTAQQIAGLGEGWYLNLEGTALGGVLEQHGRVAEHGVDAGRLVLLLGGVAGRVGLFPQLRDRDVLFGQFFGRALRRRRVGDRRDEGEGQRRDQDEKAAWALHAPKVPAGSRIGEGSGGGSGG